MAGISASPDAATGGFPELISHCLPSFLEKGHFEAAYEQQNYVVVDEWFAKDKVQFQGGNQIQYRVVLGRDGSARMVDPMEPTVRNYAEKGKTASCPWVIAEGTATWDEIVASRFTHETDLIGYMDEKWFLGVNDKVAKVESQAFVTPDNSTDGKNARGVPYWVNFLDTGTVNFTGGFLGKTLIYGDGTTDTSVGGIDKNTETLWRNWACNYTGTVDSALLDAIELSLRFTDFRAPRMVSEYTQAKRPQRRIYSGLTQEAQYQRLRNMGNDDRNGDVRPFGFMGEKTFSGVDWIGMASLEGKQFSPIYVLDMPNFFPFVLRGWYFKRTKPMNDPAQPNTYSVFMYTQFNFACKMPRRQAVFHTTF